MSKFHPFFAINPSICHITLIRTFPPIFFIKKVVKEFQEVNPNKMELVSSLPFKIKF